MSSRAIRLRRAYASSACATPAGAAAGARSAREPAPDRDYKSSGRSYRLFSRADIRACTLLPKVPGGDPVNFCKSIPYRDSVLVEAVLSSRCYLKSRKQIFWVKMRLSVFVCVALVSVILAEGAGRGNCEHFTKQRAKPREIRGYQPEFVSTAIGFGKRETANNQDKFERILRYYLQSSPPQSIPVGWFLVQMRKNPEVAKQVMKKIFDDSEEENSSAGRVSSDHFNPERSNLFY